MQPTCDKTLTDDLIPRHLNQPIMHHLILLAFLTRPIESVYVGGKTYTEAAKESGCNYDTMRKRIKYAFGRLKKLKFPRS